MYFYYITIGLQAICAIHCLKRGNQGKWLLAIIFLPIVGSLMYIFTEVFTDREIQKVQAGVGGVFQSAGRIKKLEENLRFADTFNNRVALADAYLAGGQTDKAIQLYEMSRTGAFTENEHLLLQLMVAYSQTGRFEDVILIAKKIYTLPQFARSRSHILYAIALENTGNTTQAEKEFMMMKSRFSNFEARYHYGLFLSRTGRQDEARHLFTEIVDETGHLTPRERRYNHQWFTKIKDELKKLNAA